MMNNYSYYKAKESVKKVKNFYITAIFVAFLIPIVVIVNLKVIAPHFHWFWFIIGGLMYVLITYWLHVFGFEKLNFVKKWKTKKIKELINKHNN